MSSPKLCQTCEITLPSRSFCDRSLDEALRLERGPVAYEILSRRMTPAGLRVCCRTLPLADWQKIKSLPRRQWPLVPESEKRHLRARIEPAVEAALLALAGLLLLGATVSQALEVNSLWRYRSRLALAAPSAPAGTVSSLAQEHWAALLNRVSDALATVQGRLIAFDCTPSGGTLRVSAPREADLEPLLAQATGKKITEQQEGLWSWRE